MDVETFLDMPGGDDFQDVTQMLVDGVRGLQVGELILAEGYTLQDAMGAIEIGEPRFDSGLTSEKDETTPFDPLRPLLPEEVCWILDRSFTCEMQWHAGYTLSQTVFTLLYVHHLNDIDPDFIFRDKSYDSKTPRELITTVLRSAILGLLKCCDLSWRELSKDRVFDGEDWQSEKCDVSLLEGFSVEYALADLDEACRWLKFSNKVDPIWCDAIVARLMLRKTVLQLMEFNASQEYQRFPELITLARQYLKELQPSIEIEVAEDSPARLSFDPRVSRRLNSFIPLHIITLPPQAETWDHIEKFLDSLEEVHALSGTVSIRTWEIVGRLRAWAPSVHGKWPYTRSSTQSAFFDGVLIMNRFSLDFIVSRFFVENLDIPYTAFTAVVRKRWQGSEEPPFPEMERQITSLVISHIKALWLNPPRLRRHLMKSLNQWHELYVLFHSVISQLTPVYEVDKVAKAPNVVSLFRLSAIRDIIFSGFQLELFTTEERVFAYWYAAQVIETHLHCLDDIIGVVAPNSETYLELNFQVSLLTALQAISTAIFSVMVKTLSFSWERMILNFLRRYKWAFDPGYGYETNKVKPVGHPQFKAFMSACETIFGETSYSPAGSIELATSILSDLLTSPSVRTAWWHNDRRQFIRELLRVCEGLSVLPASMKDVPAFDTEVLKWDPEKHPWFPFIQ